MAILSAFIPTFAADVVAIYGDGFSQVFNNGRPIKAMVRESSKVMEHPIETGATITDFRIILPIEIELSLIINTTDYVSAYEQIRNAYLKATLLTVQTRTGTYDNMLIQEMPHDEDPDMFDVVALALKLKEAQFVTAQFDTLPASNVENPSNASTINRGEQQATAANVAQDRSAAALFFDSLRSGAL